MAYGKSQSYINRGDKAQNQFYNACLAIGKNIRKPKTRDQKVKNHVDFYVDDKIIDVKSQKSHLYIELKNDQGLDGWYFCQKINIFAFQFENHFKIISRSDLVELVQENRHYGKISTKPKDKSECLVFNWDIVIGKVKYLYKVNNNGK